MTLPVWPVGVPADARDGWQMPQPWIAPIATEMDGGNVRLRAQPGNNVATISYPLKPLTEAQWLLLDTFFRTTLNNGASRWTMTLVATNVAGDTKTVQFQPQQVPSVTRSGGWVHVVLPLRVYGM